MSDTLLDDYLPEEFVPPLTETFTSHLAMPTENWEIEAIVLIIDRRTCTCGRHYDTPNPRVMVRKRRRHHHLRSIHLERLDDDTSPPYDVPREIEYIHSHVDACQGCFHTYTPIGQFELFPHAKPPPQRPRKPDAKDETIVPYGIDDFL